MPPHGRDKLSKIEDLKSKLFSKNFQPKIEHRDNFSHGETQEVRDAWVIEEKMSDFSERFFLKTSLFKKFFVFSVGFFVLALLYGAYVFFIGGNTVSNSNIDISILGNSFTAGGEELPLQIGITNKNSLALLLVDLVVEYPRSSAGDLSGEVDRIRQSLGTIPSGAVRNENIKVTLFGEQGSVRPIRITLEYRVEGSNAIFVKEKLYEVNINSTPINISVTAPNQVSPNQDIVLKIKSTLNATKAVPQILMKVDYPVGFVFTSSTPKPSFNNNVWAFGDLAPGAEREISIVGRMVDVFDGEEKTFKIWSGTQSKADKSAIDVVFNSLAHVFLIERPFLEADFLIGGLKQREYTVGSGETINAEIRWTNNLETAVKDLQIRAKISGNAINRKSISPEQGFYDSASDTIVWDKNSISELREIDPSQTDTVKFSFSSLSLFSSSQGVMSNPSIVVDVSISGKQDISGFESQELKNSDSSTIKIISDVGFANKALYYSGPFVNTGPIPPKVEKETTYTIVWSLSNSSNNITKGIVRSSLPTWVKFVGPVSPPGEDLVYNSSTKEIVWNVGNINRGVGVTSQNREVAFRISFLPSLKQVGTMPTIINDAFLTGHDDFANVDIRVNKPALSTNLLSDSSFPPGGERVGE
jgi:hypothetical protein